MYVCPTHETRFTPLASLLPPGDPGHKEHANSKTYPSGCHPECPMNQENTAKREAMLAQERERQKKAALAQVDANLVQVSEDLVKEVVSAREASAAAQAAQRNAEAAVAAMKQQMNDFTAQIAAIKSQLPGGPQSATV